MLSHSFAKPETSKKSVRVACRSSANLERSWKGAHCCLLLTCCSARLKGAVTFPTTRSFLVVKEDKWWNMSRKIIFRQSVWAFRISVKTGRVFFIPGHVVVVKFLAHIVFPMIVRPSCAAMPIRFSWRSLIFKKNKVACRVFKCVGKRPRLLFGTLANDTELNKCVARSRFAWKVGCKAVELGPGWASRGGSFATILCVALS